MNTNEMTDKTETKAFNNCGESIETDDGRTIRRTCKRPECPVCGTKSPVADGGAKFAKLPIALEEVDSSTIDSARMSDEDVTRLGLEAIEEAVSLSTPALEAAAVLLLGSSRFFERPTPYAIAEAYEVDSGDIWDAYLDLRLALDRKVAIMLAKDRIEYEAEARRRFIEWKDDRKQAVADGGEKIHTNHETFRIERHDQTVDFWPNDYTRFQIDCLAAIAEEAKYGLAIKADLEEHYGQEVNHGRLYPNLDRLVDQGLIAKSGLDKRTNEYELTEEGRDVLERMIEWWTERVFTGQTGDESVQAAADGGKGV